MEEINFVLIFNTSLIKLSLKFSVVRIMLQSDTTIILMVSTSRNHYKRSEKEDEEML